MRFPFQRALGAALVMAAASAAPQVACADPRVTTEHELALDVHDWKVIERESGDINYYKVINQPEMSYIHAAYMPPWDTTVVGYQIPDEAKGGAQRLRWMWRAVALPKDGNECTGGHGDSAATVYVTWRRGLKWYTLKYVWSTTAAQGTVCDKRRNAFVAQDVVVAESGGPVGVWKSEDIDLKNEFRKHFEDGDPTADVPELRGVAIMSDGDQTKSESSADFARFVFVH